MISDDDLLLYYYRDGLDAAERARIGAALSEQPELAQRLQGLVARLDAAAAMPEAPVPAHTQQRWQAALASAIEREQTTRTDAGDARVPQPSRRFANARWLAAAASVAAIALVVVIATRPAPRTLAEVAAPDAAHAGDTAAYERGLKFHLASTERQLAGIERATPEERARLVESIITQNRMYAIAAERAGEPRLARVLRAFAPVLESVAHEGAEPAAGVAQLSFELRVMQERLAAETGTPADAGSATL